MPQIFPCLYARYFQRQNSLEKINKVRVKVKFITFLIVILFNTLKSIASKDK
jgi:hypothetical protein